MASTTPDNLLKLASELSKLGADLATVGGKLAEAATMLEQEAANIALENSKRWGIDVQVGVRVGPYGVVPGSVIEVKK